MNKEKKKIQFSAKVDEVPKYRLCKNCGSHPKDHEVRDFDRMWGDGKVYCKICGEFVRHFDTG